MLVIGYFAGNRRVGMLAFAASGHAIGGFDPADYAPGVAVTTTVVDTGDGQEILIPGDHHPDQIRRWVAGDEAYPADAVETAWVDDLPPYSGTRVPSRD